MNFKVWWLPFALFLFGYYVAMRLIPFHEVTVPCVVGNTLQDGLMILSAVHLSGRIIAEQEDALIPPGIIVQQFPHAQFSAKTRSTVDLIVSKRSSLFVASSYSGRSYEAVSAEAQKSGMRIREHWIEHHGIKGTAIAQYPAPGEELTDRIMHVYFSAGQTHFLIMPRLVGKPLSESRNMLEQHGFDVRVIGADHTALSGDVQLKIIDQKPFAGAIINMNNKGIVYLMAGQQSSVASEYA